MGPFGERILLGVAHDDQGEYLVEYALALDHGIWRRVDGHLAKESRAATLEYLSTRLPHGYTFRVTAVAPPSPRVVVSV